MNFKESEAYLLSLGNEVAAMKLGLENIRTLLTALGDPQKNYLKVQVAGTNGKGSVCAFLDSICRVAGVKVGLYTSPHLVSITERVRINGDDIGEDDLATFATRVRRTSEELVASERLAHVPTFFEQVTAIALLAFAQANVEIAILETGLGGRLDATTAANAEICAITRIDLDHQEYLGESIEEIAAEKAAIITGSTECVVIGENSPEVMAILRQRCSQFGIEPLNDEYEPWRILGVDADKVKVFMSFLDFPPVTLGLKGRHQLENAQTALQLAKALLDRRVFSRLEVEEGEDEFRILEGLRDARHAGRLEDQGRYLFDGAHNPGGAKALATYLDEFEQRPITLLFGAMEDKPIAEMLKLLVPRAAKVVFTQPFNQRAVAYEALLDAMPTGVTKEQTFVTDTVGKAIDIAETITPEDSIILVTGSLYLIGEVKKQLAGTAI